MLKALGVMVVMGVLLASGTVGAETRIKCASTTSTQNSGWFDYLLPIFEKKTGIKVDVVAVGLAHKKWQRALELSSGETKRLGIARAMVINPEILMLDEPTANIDQANTTIIEGIILKMRQERQATILMITHDPAQAERLGDELLLIQDGKIIPA